MALFDKIQQGEHPSYSVSATRSSFQHCFVPQLVLPLITTIETRTFCFVPKIFVVETPSFADTTLLFSMDLLSRFSRLVSKVFAGKSTQSDGVTKFI